MLKIRRSLKINIIYDLKIKSSTVRNVRKIKNNLKEATDLNVTFPTKLARNLRLPNYELIGPIDKEPILTIQIKQIITGAFLLVKLVVKLARNIVITPELNLNC